MSKHKKLKNIKRYHDLEIHKSRVRYEIKYKQDLMKNELVVIRANFHRSVLLSLRNLAQDTLSSLIVKLVTRKRKNKRVRKQS